MPICDQNRLASERLERHKEFRKRRQRAAQKKYRQNLTKKNATYTWNDDNAIDDNSIEYRINNPQPANIDRAQSPIIINEMVRDSDQSNSSAIISNHAIIDNITNDSNINNSTPNNRVLTQAPVISLSTDSNKIEIHFFL